MESITISLISNEMILNVGNEILNNVYAECLCLMFMPNVYAECLFGFLCEFHWHCDCDSMDIVMASFF